MPDDRRVTGLVDTFFYGLFMDPDLLRSKGLAPEGFRIGSIKDVGLRIGRRAALVAQPGSRTYGVVMRLQPDELDRLYSEPTVRDYVPGIVRVELDDGSAIDAQCYNLPVPPAAAANATYAAKLRDTATRLGLPAAYVETIGRDAVSD